MEYKKLIPKLLCLFRILITPILIILTLFKLYKIVLILVVLAFLTNLADNILANIWDSTSLKKTKLDILSNKILEIGLLFCLIFKNKSFILLFILELLICLSNLYYHKKMKRTTILNIGKIKTFFLSITIILFYLCLIKKGFYNIMNGFKVATINLQVLSLISYFINYYKIITRKNISVENNIEHKKIMEDKTIEIDNLVDLAKKYGTYDEKKDDIY